MEPHDDCPFEVLDLIDDPTGLVADYHGSAEYALARSIEDARIAARNAVPLEERIATAAREVKARRERKANPSGSFDRRGRWYPTFEERCPHCSAIRAPSVNYPYTLLVHARTAQHVAAREGLPQLEVKRAARRLARMA